MSNIHILCTSLAFAYSWSTSNCIYFVFTLLASMYRLGLLVWLLASADSLKSNSSSDSSRLSDIEVSSNILHFTLYLLELPEEILLSLSCLRLEHFSPSNCMKDVTLQVNLFNGYSNRLQNANRLL